MPSTLHADWIGTECGLLYIGAGATQWTIVPWTGSTVTPFVVGIRNRTGVTIEQSDGDVVHVFSTPLATANLMTIAASYGSRVNVIEGEPD